MKKSVLIKLIVSILMFSVLILTEIPQRAAATMSYPYICYNYDYRSILNYAPAAYEPGNSINTSTFTYQGENVGKLSSPQDLCKSADGKIYVADTGNNRIIILNSSMTEVINIISSFDNNGKQDTFNTPTGVAVSEDYCLYIADTRNKRIVVLDENGVLLSIVDNPTSEVLEDGFVFQPLKVSVDYANRIYCIAQNQFEGIMVFDTNGKFTGFFGTIPVTISTWEKFWRRIATKAERSNQQLYIPTEFTGIDIDEDGFVYATNIDSAGTQAVRRLNPKGEDVIKKGEDDNLGGDIWNGGSGDYAGSSQFVDVIYRGDGIYSCLDRRRGRIFTYDHEGNLLYVFGGIGTQRGTFSMPVAIDIIGDQIIVLDSSRAEISVFNETEYGDMINQAVSLRFSGDETQAVELWKRVLELNENNELANTGIGKAYLTAGDYKNAMKYLKLGMSRTYYSIAFRRYRNAILKDNIGYVFTAVLILIIAFVVWRKIRQRKKSVKARGRAA